MPAQITRFLKLDQSLPDPYGKAVWVEQIENATPFEESEDALRAGSLVKNASGVIRGADDFWYVTGVWDALSEPVQA